MDRYLQVVDVLRLFNMLSKADEPDRWLSQLEEWIGKEILFDRIKQTVEVHPIYRFTQAGNWVLLW